MEMKVRIATLGNGKFRACCPSLPGCTAVGETKEEVWRKVTYCAAGHPGGALQMADAIEHLPSTGPLLGSIEEAEWAERVLELQPCQRLWLYTDGLIEAGVPHDKFDLQGLDRILQHTADRSLEEQASALLREAVSRQGREAEDDVTIVGMERLASNHREGGQLLTRAVYI